jgi:hypothetical protein
VNVQIGQRRDGDRLADVPPHFEISPISGLDVAQHPPRAAGVEISPLRMRLGYAITATKQHGSMTS